MWNATFDSAVPDEQVKGIVNITFTFTPDDGREPITITDRFSDPGSYLKYASDKIRELERIDAIEAFAKAAPIGPIDLTPPQPTPEQLAQQDYEAKRQELITKKQDLDLGLIEQTDYNAAIADAKTSAANVSAAATLTTM